MAYSDRDLWMLDAWTVALNPSHRAALDVHQVAGPGARCLAGTIDLAIQAAAALVMIIWAARYAPALVPPGSGWWFFPTAAIEWHILYYLLFEALTGGVTPGKRLMNLRVIDAPSCRPIRPSQSIIRNLCRLIDILPVAYFAALVSMFCARGRRRFGDRLARTIVVSSMTLDKQLESARVSDSLYAASSEGYMLESYIQRRVCMDAVIAETLDEKIAGWFHKSFGAPDALTIQAWNDGRYWDYLQGLYWYEKSLVAEPGTAAPSTGPAALLPVESAEPGKERSRTARDE